MLAIGRLHVVADVRSSAVSYGNTLFIAALAPAASVLGSSPDAFLQGDMPGEKSALTRVITASASTRESFDFTPFQLNAAS
jgi:hypothetical protein